MPANMTELEKTINRFEDLLKEMKEATREAHIALKSLSQERKEIEKLLSTEVKVLVDKRVGEVVKTELDRIGPQLRDYSDEIYKKVGVQIDKIVNLSLGKEFTSIANKEDLRPQLAERLRAWLREIIFEDQ